MDKRIKFLAAVGVGCALGTAIAVGGTSVDTFGESKGDLNGSVVPTEVIEQDTESISAETARTVDDYDYHEVLSLGKCTGYSIPVSDASVTEEEVDTALADLTVAFPEYVKSEKESAEYGDYVNVSYSVREVDGEVLDAYSMENTEVCIGNAGYLDEFNQGLIGMSAGDTKRIGVRVPEDYWDPNLCGKNLEYTVLLQSIDVAETPTVTDEWIAGVSDYSTVEEWRDAKFKELTAVKLSTQRTEFEEGVLEEIKKNSEFIGIPEELVASLVSEYVAEDEEYAKTVGLSLDELVQKYYRYDSKDEYLSDAYTNLYEYVKDQFVMRALEDEFNVGMTDDDFRDFLESMAEEYGMSSPEECLRVCKEDVLRTACLEKLTWDAVLAGNEMRVE